MTTHFNLHALPPPCAIRERYWLCSFQVSITIISVQPDILILTYCYYAWTLNIWILKVSKYWKCYKKKPHLGWFTAWTNFFIIHFKIQTQTINAWLDGIISLYILTDLFTMYILVLWYVYLFHFRIFPHNFVKIKRKKRLATTDFL